MKQISDVIELLDLIDISTVARDLSESARLSYWSESDARKKYHRDHMIRHFHELAKIFDATLEAAKEPGKETEK